MRIHWTLLIVILSLFGQASQAAFGPSIFPRVDQTTPTQRTRSAIDTSYLHLGELKRTGAVALWSDYSQRLNAILQAIRSRPDFVATDAELQQLEKTSSEMHDATALLRWLVFSGPGSDNAEPMDFRTGQIAKISAALERESQALVAVYTSILPITGDADALQRARNLGKEYLRLSRVPDGGNGPLTAELKKEVLRHMIALELRYWDSLPEAPSRHYGSAGIGIAMVSTAAGAIAGIGAGIWGISELFAHNVDHAIALSLLTGLVSPWVGGYLGMAISTSWMERSTPQERDNERKLRALVKTFKKIAGIESCAEALMGAK